MNLVTGIWAGIKELIKGENKMEMIGVILQEKMKEFNSDK